jgi:hypothetical protein
MTLYKSLKNNNCSPYAGFDFTPYLPKNGKPGRWLPKVANLELCISGYHGCKDGDILEYLRDNIYEIETRGKVLDGDDKFTAQQIRLVRKCEGWNEVTARLFACNCAAHVLHIFEKKYPEDKRPRECIEMARKFARGKATREELASARDAAQDAAGDAAQDAACDAAGYAEGYAAWYAARYAAWCAARYAAWCAARYAAGYAEGYAAGDAAGHAARYAAQAAARYAAGDAAGDAEGYAALYAAQDAAWCAARYAAGDAEGYAARYAAQAAARYAAGHAAGHAAWAAEKKWQTRRLFKLLK